MKIVGTNYLLVLFLSSLLFVNFQCNDCEDELHDRTGFSVRTNSDQSTFSIGDTILISSSISSQIELEFSGIIHDNTDQLINYKLEVFEGVNNDIDVIEGRDNFEFINIVGNVFVPPSRTWEIRIENTCNETLCELEFGLIPQRTGYFGLFLQTGNLGFNNECQSLSLIPTGIESSGSNNFEIFDEIDLNSIRIDGSFFRNPESENLLYFFKVIE